VVICAPLGHEYTHSYRSLLHLAERLSEAGMPVLRFDYHGCGSSSGDVLDTDLIGAWREDVLAAVTLMARFTGGPTSVVGLRLGATLAALATSRFYMEHFVAWAPVVAGRQYLREQKALSRLEAASSASGSGGFNAGGFFLTKEVESGIRSLDVADIGCRMSGEALVVEPVDLVHARGLAERFRRDGIPTEVVAATDYTAMMQKPHLSVVPRETVDLIVEWLAARVRPRGTAVRRLPRETSVVSVPTGSSVVEELVQVPGSAPLFGVLTTPLGPASDTSPLLLLTNAGSAHNVGPNRLYVEMSRRLAAQGFASLRLDLSNLGDSSRGLSDDQNHPYPTTAVADMARAIEWLRRERGVERVVLGGLCSGAYHAFRCGVELSDGAIVGMLLINPLTFRWSKDGVGMVSEDATPHARLADAKKWRKLIHGHYEPLSLVRFAARALYARSAALTSRVLDRMGVLPPRPLDREILRCVSMGRRLDFVYSTHDPGYGLLRASTGATVARLERVGALSISRVEGADHSFSRRASREDLLSLAERHMSRYVVGASAADPVECQPDQAPRRRIAPLVTDAVPERLERATSVPI
jgi:predicted alpha/beta hydrolase